MPVAVPSKALDCGRSIAGVAGSNSAEYMDIFLFVLYRVGSGLCDEMTLMQRSPNVCVCVCVCVYV